MDPSLASDEDMSTSPEEPTTSKSAGVAGKASLRNPVHLLALGFGSGLAPVAPGTAGTAVGLLLYLPLASLHALPYVLVVAAAAIAGIWLCDITARELGTQDDPRIVWDEITGYLTTMAGAPSGWLWIVLGFLLFRLFDIWKPWPIRPIDRRVGGGFGIMLDDILAGMFAALCMQLLNRLVVSA